MIRTQIYLPEDLYHRVQLEAKRTKKKPAAVFRELLRVGLQKKHVNAGKTLLDIAGLGIKGPRDLSARVDEYLYE